MEIKNENIIVFMDGLGRTIFAEKNVEKTTANVLAVFNPVVVHVQSNPQGQSALQLIPLFFREFMADKEEKITWNYNRSNIVESSEIKFDFKLYAQYTQMFNIPMTRPQQPTQNQAPQPQSAPKKIVLFDE